MAMITHKQHKQALQIFIDSYESNPNSFEKISKYTIEDHSTGRQWWIGRGPSYFTISRTKNNVLVFSVNYRFLWWLSPVHRQAWKYAKKIIALKKTEEIKL